MEGPDECHREYNIGTGKTQQVAAKDGSQEPELLTEHWRVLKSLFHLLQTNFTFQQPANAVCETLTFRLKLLNFTYNC